MSTQIADATSLVDYIKSFTGSSNDDEIKQCIYLAELMMRNIELPALDRKSTRLNSSHSQQSRMPSSA